LNRVDLGVVAQTEVYRQTRLGQVSARGVHLPNHYRLSDPEANEGADCITVALRSCQSEFEVVPSRKPVGEKVGAVVEVVGNDLEPSVAVEIGHRGTP